MVTMDSTEDEVHSLNSLVESPSTHPPSYSLKIKIPSKRQRSNSLGLYTSSQGISTELTGRPNSPPVSEESGLILNPDTRPASSWWPQNGGTPDLHRSSTSPEPGPNSEVDVGQESPQDFLSISMPHSSAQFESLSSRDASAGRSRSKLGPATVNREELGLPSTTPWYQIEQKNEQTFWKAIETARVPIYLENPGFDTLAFCPWALGTHCSPIALLTAFSDNEVFYHAYAAGQKLSRDDLIPSKSNYDGGILQHATDLVLAEYGTALTEHNNGQHFTFINVKQDTTSDTIVQRSRGLVERFQENGVTKDRIVVSIPANEQGVHATRLLAEDGILVNLTMVAGMSHAAVCTEAGATWITFHLDRLEKVYEDLGEPSQGTKEIQNTIALFHMHNVGTKIMINAFRNARSILEFPGAHGFSITREQINCARLPSLRSYHIPRQSASSLPEHAINRAKGAKWPPRFLDTIGAGGINGSFVRYFPSRHRTIVSSIQKDLFDHTGRAIRDFLTLIREDVANYRVLMMRLTNPHIGDKVLAQLGAKVLKRIVNSKKDLRSAEAKWKNTVTGRFLQDVEWQPAYVNKCDAWITADGRIQAQIPVQWDRRMAADMDVEGYF